jgi:hypothetical protein
MGELRYLDATGDQKVIWDPQNEDEVEAAESTFDSLKEKGFKAFKVGKNGKKTTEMKDFDPEAGKVIMVPRMVAG